MVIGKCTYTFRGIFLVGGLRGGGYMGEISMEECVMGEDNFHEGIAGFVYPFFKEQWKNKYEKVSSTESKEQH